MLKLINLRYCGLKCFPLLFAQRLHQPPCGHDTGRKTAARLDPLPAQIEILQSRQGLAQVLHHRGGRVLRRERMLGARLQKFVLQDAHYTHIPVFVTVLAGLA